MAYLAAHWPDNTSNGLFKVGHAELLHVYPVAAAIQLELYKLIELGVGRLK